MGSIEHMTHTQQKTEEFMKAYDDLCDAIFKHCYYRVYDRERAKELMQECFTRTWECIAEGKEIKNLKAFVYRVANNLIIDSSRKKKESSLDALMEEGYEPSVPSQERVQAAAEYSEVRALLNRLDEKHRDVVRMRYLQQLSPKEIGEALGESENVVSVRLHRAMKQLQHFLN